MGIQTPVHSAASHLFYLLLIHHVSLANSCNALVGSALSRGLN